MTQLHPVLTCAEVEQDAFAQLLAAYRLEVVKISLIDAIPGSYWGECEAGLIRNQLFIRDDTPLHSALHEACHYICMTPERRLHLHTDAGSDDMEENAVCYLQILLADFVPIADTQSAQEKHCRDDSPAIFPTCPIRSCVAGRQRLWQDMDTWGYSFRLGSARAWFEQDAHDARAWLIQHHLIDEKEQPSWRLRVL